MISTTYNYNSGGSFNYSSTEIGFAGGFASLLPVNNPLQTESPNISASTFNSSLLNYAGGSLKQLDQRPSTATFYAAWASMLNANWSGQGNGSLIVTPLNGASLIAGVLDLSGYANKYITFNATNNCDSLQTGTIEFVVIPSYSGAPSDNQLFFTVSEVEGSSADSISVFHYTDNNLYLQIINDAGNTLIDIALHTWNPVSGTSYTITVTFDLTGGNTNLYVNGTSVANSAVTFTRSSPTFGTIGKAYNSVGNANFKIQNLSFYSSVLTPLSPILSSTIYPAATASLPEFTYAGLGSIQAWSLLSITDMNAPAYTLNGLYWSGSAWVSSNGTYAQANIASISIANITTLPALNTLQINSIYSPSNTQASLSAINVKYTGQVYPTDPIIYPTIPLSMDSLSSFTDVESETGSDGIGWFLHIGSVNYWFNSTAWVVTNKSFAQSNTAEQILDNASSLPISSGAFITPNAILHSATGLTTPTLTSLTLEYDYFGPSPPGPNKCSVFGYIQDEAGNPITGAVVQVTNPATFLNQGIVEAQGIKTVSTNSTGYFHFNLNETTTVNAPLKFSVVYPFTGVASNIYTFGSALIPNVPEVNFSTLTFTS